MVVFLVKRLGHVTEFIPVINFLCKSLIHFRQGTKEPAVTQQDWIT